MEDIVAKQAEIQVKKKSYKKIIFIVVGSVLVLALFYVGYILAKSMGAKKEMVKETPKEVKRENLISTTSIRSYKIEIPSVTTVASFIYEGDPTPLFNPLNVYFLTDDNKVVGVPFYVSAVNSFGSPWCFGGGKDANTLSYDKTSLYCVESINDKELTVRRLDLRGREYKEYNYSVNGGLFVAGRDAKVISSRDGDSALIYSSAGAFIFESTTGSLFTVDMPLNLEITKVVYLSNVETALITSTNKIYRVNFSSHKGGVFDVNFAGLDNTKLSNGLKTARLSKDGRRIIFAVSDQLDKIPEGTNPDYQTVIAYNIALDSGRVSDELDRAEKFLISCKNNVGNKYCLYESIRGKDDNTEEVLYLKEYDLPLVEVTKTRSVRGTYKIAIQLIDGNPDYFFVKVPIFSNAEKREEFTWSVYSYKTSDKTLKPLAF